MLSISTTWLMLTQLRVLGGARLHAAPLLGMLLPGVSGMQPCKLPLIQAPSWRLLVLELWVGCSSDEFSGIRGVDLKEEVPLDLHLNYLKLLAVFHALQTFCEELSGLAVSVIFDNSMSETSVNVSWSRRPLTTMALPDNSIFTMATLNQILVSHDEIIDNNTPILITNKYYTTSTQQ
ncbi:hypothetical protein E2C01_025489 [Portunus trituberculatus]|uniref:Uncharacterized protein n=1 Tax=Portunus trituberculatus TaxID=210409 RepID=A0A5B7EGK6_PORTR|nr:hypothetical protein [Portunus trituberculatus]